MAQPQFDNRTGFNPDAVVSSDPIEIDAPAEVVWDVLTDLPRYGAWNPFCVWAECTLEMGAPMHMSLADYTTPGRLIPNVEYICAYDVFRRLSWEMPWTQAWPYPARRDQIIEPLSPARCRYHSTDAFLGDNGIHVMRFAGGWIKRAFDDTARALKTRAEALYVKGDGGK